MTGLEINRLVMQVRN